MTDAIFNVEMLSEDADFEAKAAQGRDGKGDLPKDIWETYSAFANTDGGVILLGVEQLPRGGFRILGIEKPDRVVEHFWTQLNNPQKVSRNLLSESSVMRKETDGGKWLISIVVPRAARRQRPVYINGNPMSGTFKRFHEGDFRCPEEEVRRMLAEQVEDERDARIVEGFDLEDIDRSTLSAFRNRLAAVKPDHPYNNEDGAAFLRKIGGWRKDRATGIEGLTLAGLLMFGKHESIREAVPNFFLDYRELPASGSKTEWVDRLVPDGTWPGNLYAFYRAATERLFRGLKVPFRLDGDERTDDTPVHKALREALVNALIHADYSASTSILVVKAPDYFGFRNPGRMRIPIKMALEGGTSDCRNRSVQLMFSLIGLGEQAGSGIPRVLENWRTQHYRMPELWELLEPESTLLRMRTVSLVPKETVADLRSRFGDAFDVLDENGRLALVTAAIERFVTNARMQQITRLHTRDITALLKRLVDERLLEQDGHGRATSYRISGTEVVDLANNAEFFEPQGVHVMEASLQHKRHSLQHKDDSLQHSISGEPEPATNPELRRIAQPVREKARANPEEIRSIILQLCTCRWLTNQEIAALLGRAAGGVHQRFVKPLTDDGLLIRRYPNQPSHERQAYRVPKSGDE